MEVYMDMYCNAHCNSFRKHAIQDIVLAKSSKHLINPRQYRSKKTRFDHCLPQPIGLAAEINEFHRSVAKY